MCAVEWGRENDIVTIMRQRNGMGTVRMGQENGTGE